MQNPQPYGFAKFHKKHAAASCFIFSCKLLAQFKHFSDSTLRKEKVPEAEIEAPRLLARQKLETLEFESNEHNVSIDVKSTYTNFPLSEVIEVTLKCLFSIETTPDIGKMTHEFPLKRSVKNVYFKSNGNWYRQKNGLAIGACLLSAILASKWRKTFLEKRIAGRNNKMSPLS